MDNLPGMTTASLRASEHTAPLYEVVKRRITEAIMMGQWPAGTVLPSEISLSQTFGVAVGTIRRALTDLTNEGLLSRRRKTGTVVTGRSPQHSLRFFFQYFRLHGVDGSLQRSTTRILQLGRDVGTDEEIAKLHIDGGSRVIRFQRLRSIANKPIMHETITVPEALLPNFPSRKEDIPELFYFFLLERYGIRISAVREQIGATLASEQDAELLHLELPSAILMIDEVAYDQSDSPVLVAEHRATTTGHRYVHEVK